MKYHSAPLIPHKSALMSAPANLLAEEVCLPAALLKKSALENNISWMQRYADARGVSLAPHGKTTMTPWIFQAQQRAGAWGIGVGSVWQASAAMASGIQRVLMVNQLVGKANMQVVAQLKAHYRAVDFICCVDSEVNVRALSAFFADQGQTLDVLIELGVPGGRCGCRSVDDALALAQRVSDLPGLRLRGLELYEGVLHGDDPQPQVEALLQQAAALACRMEPLVDGEFILTGAGTVWYDVVCNIWLAAAKPRRCRRSPRRKKSCASWRSLFATPAISRSCAAAVAPAPTRNWWSSQPKLKPPSSTPCAAKSTWSTTTRTMWA